MNFIFRQFQAEDAQDVYEVARIAWNHTYNDIFEPEFIENFVNGAYHPKSLPRTLKFMKKGYNQLNVAVLDKKVVGFVEFGFEEFWTEKPNLNKMNLGRIYILPEFIGKGLGSKLLKLGEKWVIDQGCRQYYCMVHKDNTLGLNFYLRKGFKRHPDLDSEEDGELCLIKQL